DLLAEVLDELLEEEGALENWAENGDPAIDSVLNAWLADPDDMPYYGHPDDLSNLADGTDLDLTGYGYADLSAYQPAVAGIELAEQRREQEQKRVVLTRLLARERYRATGGLTDLMSAYAESTAGHAMDLANEATVGIDAAIELAATGHGQPCSVPDAF